MPLLCLTSSFYVRESGGIATEIGETARELGEIAGEIGGIAGELGGMLRTCSECLLKARVKHPP